MDPELLARGIILGFTIAAAIGPISLLVIRRTIADGRVVGLVSGMGVATADATYGAIAAFGLGAITDILVGGQRILGLVGGLFLLWLAWRTARAVPTDPATTTEQRRGLAGAYLSILALTLTNPMTILAFAALFAGLGIAPGNVAGAASLTLGVFLGSSTWWLALTLTVAAVRPRVTKTWLGRINIASGIVIGLFAVVTIGTAIRG